MLQGSCHCGAVRYKSDGEILFFAHCHCPDCRKFTGSAFASVLGVESSGFQVTQGKDNLVAFASSPGKHRHFCRTCGCQLFGLSEEGPDMTILLAGCLDNDPESRPQCHVWVSEKAPWYEITDDLPQFPGFPPR